MPTSERRPEGVSARVGLLGQIVGPAQVLADPGVVVSGVCPEVQVTPGTDQELARILAFASKSGFGVCIAGGGTKLEWGNRPRKADILLRTEGLTGITEFDPENLSLSARAGTSISTLMTAADQAGVLLPLDSDAPEHATVGGVVATGDQGARRMMYGGLRDVVLGLKAVLADGSCVSFGGRTMKNVTGYDLTKLFVGSFGSLGVITEVTLRLLPRPAASALAVLRVRSLREAQALVERVFASVLEPVCLEVLSPGITPLLGREAWDILGLDQVSAGPVLVAGFAGYPAAVERSLREMRACLAAVTSVEASTGAEKERFSIVTDAPDVAGFYGALSGLRESAAHADWSVIAKIDLPLSEVWPVAEVSESATASGAVCPYRISVGSGCVQLFFGNDRTPGESSRFLTELRRQAYAAGGHLVVVQGGAGLGPSFDVWGDLGSSVEVMKALKTRFDPAGILNSGRFVGGL